MNNTFNENELLYRAVYPPEINHILWKDNQHVSSAAFLDKRGLSVERGDIRSDEEVLKYMRKSFIGRFISVTVGLCHRINAKVIYKPTKRSIYHSEIHGSEKQIVLTPAQRRFLSLNCRLIKSEA